MSDVAAVEKPAVTKQLAGMRLCHIAAEEVILEQLRRRVWYCHFVTILEMGQSLQTIVASAAWFPARGIAVKTTKTVCRQLRLQKAEVVSVVARRFAAWGLCFLTELRPWMSHKGQLEYHQKLSSFAAVQEEMQGMVTAAK